MARSGSFCGLYRARPDRSTHSKEPSLKILIFGVNYSPEETGIGPYTTGLAEFLVDEGHSVTVVTGFPSYPQWRIRPPYRGLLWRNERLNGVLLWRRWNYVPSAQSAIHRALYELTIFLSGLPALAGPKPDLVLGIVPGLSGGLLARLSAHRFKVPYGLLFQDLMGLASEQSGIEGGRAVARIVARLERWAIGRAATVGVIAEGFKPYLVSLGMPASRIHRLRNWNLTGRPTQDRDVTRAQLGLLPEEFVCIHAGNMGLKQELSSVIECARLAEASDPAIRFLLVGDGNQKQRLQELSAGYGLKNLRFLGVQSDQEFPNVLAAADVLLLNQSATVSDMALPSKLTAYFASGRPIVAAVGLDSECAREIEASGGGEVVPPGSPEALLGKIRELAIQPDRVVDLGKRGEDYARTELSADAAGRLFRVFLQDVAK
jgi:colanic acid biosynthesis glycosyl transferase WcaI